MSSLKRCADCGSFVVDGHCPNCGGLKVSATKLGVLATLFGSTAFAMTLMACYGCPDCTSDYDDGGTDSGRDARSSSSSSSSSSGSGDDDDVIGPTDAGNDAAETGPKDAAADG